MSMNQIAAPYPIFTDLDGTPLDDGYLYIGEVSKNPETNPIQVYWDAALTQPAPQPIRTTAGYPWRMGTPALLYANSQFSMTIRNKKRDLVLYAPVGFGINPQAVGGSIVKDDYTGDGSRTAFTISSSPSTPLAVDAFINGAYQNKDTYSIVGNVLTFTQAPPLNASIELLSHETGVIGSTNAMLVSYTPPFAGGVTTDVGAKLSQSVSVKDFGAKGDGIVDDTAAVQAAVDSCLSSGAALFVPPGNYKLSSQINVPLYSASVNRGFVIFGSGHASRFIVDHTGTGFYVTCIPSFMPFKAEFRDLYFTDGAANPARIIHNNGAINTVIRDCMFENATVSVGCVVNDNAYGLSLHGCVFTGIVGTGVFYAQTSNISTYSFVNSIIDCDFSTVSVGVTIQGCDAFLVLNTVFQECNIGFYANPISTQTTAFNISFDACWFERNTTFDIELDSNANYWCEASIRNCQFSGFDPTYQAHIQLAQKSKVTIEGTPSGNTVIVSGANDAAAVLIRATNFVQSGVYAWTSIDPYGNVVAKTYKSLSGVYVNPASGATVTLATLPSVLSGTWLVSVMLDGFNSASGAHCFGILVAQGPTAVYTAIKTAASLAVSVSGLNLQGNQTSGAPYSITWSLTRLN